MRILPQPPWSRIGKKIESTIRKALYEFSMVENAPHIAVAVSGGKDSITLLAFLHTISGRGFPPFKITALHISGSYSCGADAGTRYLHELCERLNISLIEEPLSQQTLPKDCYHCARERRRRLFEIAKNEGAHTIAFGHHQDDNAQTLLMNLCHKGEFAGMLPKIFFETYKITIIRPLIFLPEELIRSFAKEYHFFHTICQCPRGQQSHRKKINHILEALSHLYPHSRSNIAQAALLFGSQKAATRSKKNSSEDHHFLE